MPTLGPVLIFSQPHLCAVAVSVPNSPYIDPRLVAMRALDWQVRNKGNGHEIAGVGNNRSIMRKYPEIRRGRTRKLLTEKLARNGKTTRHLVPKVPFESTSCAFFIYPTPLLKEERHVRSYALVTNTCDPFHVHWTRSGS